jgi:hypothetical protein
MNTRKKLTSLLVTAAACFVLHTVVAAEVPVKNLPMNEAQASTQTAVQ